MASSPSPSPRTILFDTFARRYWPAHCVFILNLLHIFATVTYGQIHLYFAQLLLRRYTFHKIIMQFKFKLYFFPSFVRSFVRCFRFCTFPICASWWWTCLCWSDRYRLPYWISFYHHMNFAAKTTAISCFNSIFSYHNFTFFRTSSRTYVHPSVSVRSFFDSLVCSERIHKYNLPHYL